MGKKDIEFKVAGTNEQLAEYLEKLAAGLRESTLYIEQGNQAITLNPSEDITLELEAKKKDEKQKLSIKLSWRSVPKVSEGESALTISTDVPPPAEPEVEEETVAEEKDPVKIEKQEPESPLDDDEDTQEKPKAAANKAAKKSSAKK
jgi:amphi-Trp domain-containing protein